MHVWRRPRGKPSLPPRSKDRDADQTREGAKRIVTTTTGQTKSSPSIPALRELLEKATPRPWHGNDSVCSEVGGIGQMHHDADTALIVAAINALPALLDVVEAAEAHVSNRSAADWHRLTAALSHLHGGQG